MKITVKTHYLHIESEDADLLYNIDRRFAIPVPNYWFSPKYKEGKWDGRKHFFSLHTMKMLSGLLEELVRWLDENNVQYTIEDLRKPIEKVEPILELAGKSLGSVRFDYQKEAVEAVLKHGRGVLEVATNGGKTLIAASIIASLDKPTLYIVGIKELMFQTAERFREYIPHLEIGEFGAGIKRKEFVTVAMAQSVHNIKKKNWFKDFEIIIVDEAHHLPSDTLENIMLKCPARYRIGMSGTAFDEDPTRNMRLIGHTGPRLIKVTNADLIQRGVSAVPKIHFVYADVDKVLDSRLYKTYHNVVKDGLSFCEPRNKQILSLINRFYEEGKTLLVLSPHIKQLYELYNVLQEERKVDPLYFSIGSTPDFIRRSNLEAFREDGGVMLASVIFDEGVDIPAIDVLLLIGAGTKERRFLQRIGRGLRFKPQENRVDVYDFVDWHHKYLEKHSANRLNLYLKEGFEVVAEDKEAAEWLEITRGKLEGDMVIPDEELPDPNLKKKKEQYINNNLGSLSMSKKFLQFKNKKK